MSELQQSNISWVNKDFQKIYPELLEKAAQLSYRWTPMTSNETDPGIVFLKELAIALDKVNYTADKNALEAFPMSTTQQGTSRQIFQLLGYYPHWYKSAVASIEFLWTGEYNSESITSPTLTVPAFTEITNAEKTFTYTTIEDCVIDLSIKYNTVKALEGSVKQLDVNNKIVITEDMLDRNNRIYLADYYIAENGIFISNIDAENKPTNDFWVKVDNLKTKSLGTSTDSSSGSLGKMFSFDIDPISNLCYIEFPDNISSLIGNGLDIRYLITTGSQGNIPTGELNTFASEVKGSILDGAVSSEIILNSDNIRFMNIGLISGGEDIESINDSWNGYKHIQNTFNTLVTVNDYTDAIYNLDGDNRVANDFVCDRTNDVQDSFDVVISSGVSSFKRQFNENQSEPLQPYHLKVYALKYNNVLQTKSDYDETFKIFDDISVNEIDSKLFLLLNELENYKCLSHEYKAIDENKIALLKNLYTLDLTIIPTSTLSDLQQKTLTNDIKLALYKEFNARKMTFGEKVDYESLIYCIKNSSTKIKHVSLANLAFETHAIYRAESEWKDIIISDEHDSYQEGYFYNGKFYHDLEHKNEFTSNELITNTYYLDLSNNYIYYLPGNLYNQATTFQLYAGKYPTTSESDTISYRDWFRNDIIAKSILCGVTPIINDVAADFPYQINQSGQLITKASQIRSNKDFIFNFVDGEAKVQVLDNEVLSFQRPTTTTIINYGIGCRYQLYTTSENTVVIPKDGIYQLTPNDALILFYRQDDDESTYIGKIYRGTDEEPAIIRPTFRLESSTVQNAYNLFSSRNSIEIAAIGVNNSTIISLPSLAATKTIDILKPQSETINPDENYCYAITNKIAQNSNNDDEYILTFTQETEGGYIYSRTLQSGEYFIYTNSAKNTLDIYGAGTLLIVNTTNFKDANTISISFPITSTTAISTRGVAALKDYWQRLSFKTVENTFTEYPLTIREQEYVNVLSKGAVKIIDQKADTIKITIDSEGKIKKQGLENSDFTVSEDLRTGFEFEEDTTVVTEDQGGTSVSTITVSHDIDEIKSLKVNGTSISGYSISGKTITLTTSVATGSSAKVQYLTHTTYSGLDPSVMFTLLFQTSVEQENNKINYILNPNIKIETPVEITVEPIAPTDSDSAKYEFTVDSTIYIMDYNAFSKVTSIEDMVAGAITVSEWTIGESNIKNLSGLDVEYVQNYNEDENLNNWLKLNDITSDSTDLAWRARSYLNIDVGPNDPQILSDASQSITITTAENEEFIIQPGDTGEKYIYAANSLQLDGSPTNINIEYLDANNKTIYNQFYSYDRIPNTSSSSSINNNDEFVVQLGNDEDEHLGWLIIFNKNSSNQQSWQEANYIMRIVNTLGKGDTCLVSKATLLTVPQSWDKDQIQPLYDSWKAGSLSVSDNSEYQQWNQAFDENLKFELTPNNYHFSNFAKVIYDPGESQTQVVLFYEYSDEIPENPPSLTLSVLKRYSEINELASQAITRFNYLNSISNNSYDVFYKIPNANYIKNPLAAESFMNKNHPFNRYTICQIGDMDMKYLN